METPQSRPASIETPRRRSKSASAPFLPGHGEHELTAAAPDTTGPVPVTNWRRLPEVATPVIRRLETNEQRFAVLSQLVGLPQGSAALGATCGVMAPRDVGCRPRWNHDFAEHRNDRGRGDGLVVVVLGLETSNQFRGFERPQASSQIHVQRKTSKFEAALASSL